MMGIQELHSPERDRKRKFCASSLGQDSHMCAQGRLVFREGALVTAVRAGHWVVLDELNLAPSEVLEALNRCGVGFRMAYSAFRVLRGPRRA